MNTLSWLLYFAEISNNIAHFFGGVMLASAIVACILSALMTFIPETETSETWKIESPKVRGWAFTVFFISMIGLVFPTQNTIYLIIASESTEMVAADEGTREMLGDIREIITLRLDGIAGELTSAVGD